MTSLYGREIIATVAGLAVTEPHMTARVVRRADESEIEGELTIFNLASDTERAIYQRGDTVRIEAGYAGATAVIFDGYAQSITRSREPQRHVTSIKLGDTSRKEQSTAAITTRSYDGVVTIRQVAGDIIGDLGLQAGPLDTIPAGATANNFVWAGPSASALTVILSRAGCRWYEDDGIVRVRKLTQASQPSAPDLTVSPDTGLVGTPRITEDGVEAVLFLAPQLRIGSIVTITSETVSGTYAVTELEHVADNWSGRFTTWLDLRPE